MTTLKQVVTRVRQLATSHQLINQVGFGNGEDLANLIKQGITYPFCFIELKNDIPISANEKLQRFNFSLFFFDLQNVIDESRTNILEVKSDLVSIATDLLAMLQRDVDIYPNQDWIVADSTTFNIKEYSSSDLPICVELPIQIGLRYLGDVCQVPSDTPPEILEDMKIISNYKYKVLADTETLTLPLLKKEILLFSLGNNQLEQVVSNPNVGQFTYDYLTGVFVFGTTIYSDTFIQILNRPL